MEKNSESEAHIEAHKASIHHRDSVLKSQLCGCFYCLSTFSPLDIEEWTDFVKDDIGRVGRTALCPRCGIDSVLPDTAGFPLDENFLTKMYQYWFAQ